ncbi:Hypothetical predicted protein [Pelobates cultripes]|uniref:Uncharacterized protein n=1 Tax=Pelobates cultripes TaxID=61616 RepID=A0AAD1SIQ0_PELCU|nr:Hypothetical predicted protein [Pelobates cultripes]
METANSLTLHASTATVQMLKLQDEINKYKNDLIRFKKQKLEKVNNDYKYHQVYRWLGGAQDNYRPYSKLRTKIRKPIFQTIDASSGDSTSDLETSEDLKRQTSDPFLEKDRYSDEPPGTSRINTRGIKKADLRGEDRGTVKNTNLTSKPPRMRR